MSRVLTFAVLVLVLGMAALPHARAQKPEAAGNNQAARREAAMQLAQTMRIESRFKSIFDELVSQRFGQGLKNNPLAREILTRVILDRIKFVPLVKELVISTYAETYSEAELQELNAFYASPIGRKELDLKATLEAKMMSAITGNPNVVKEMYVAGCIGAVATEFVSRAEQTAGPLGMELPNAETVYAKISPLIARAETSCSCMVDQIVTKFGSERLARSGSDPEVAAFAREAMTRGACPRPPGA